MTIERWLFRKHLSSEYCKKTRKCIWRDWITSETCLNIQYCLVTPYIQRKYFITVNSFSNQKPLFASNYREGGCRGRKMILDSFWRRKWTNQSKWYYTGGENSEWRLDLHLKWNYQKSNHIFNLNIILRFRFFSWLLPRFNLILFGQSVTTGWRNSLASNDLAMLCNWPFYEMLVKYYIADKYGTILIVINSV